MQNPNEDTEWNDALRAKGIIPEKEVTEDQIQQMLDQTIQAKTEGKQLDEMDLDELNEAEDDIDEEEERLFEEYKRQRMAELQAQKQRAKFGSILEITKVDWVTEINKAGDDVWVIVHVYKDSIPLCKVINGHLSNLARKFPEVKFVKSVSELCIPNYPDKHLPTIFIYKGGDMKKQFVGAMNFGGINLKQDELEWMLSETGAIKTTLSENPKKKVHDVMDSAIRNSSINNTHSDDEDDW